MSDQPSIAAYVVVFAALMVLLAITVGVAYVPLGPANAPMALVLAAVKAVLVVLIFMHIRHAAPLVKLAAIGGFIWLAILIAFTMSDYLTRGWLDRHQAPLAESNASETLSSQPR